MGSNNIQAEPKVKKINLVNKYYSFVVFFSFLNALSSQKYVFSKNKLGSPFTITISTKDTTNLSKTIKKAFALIDSLDLIFSDYKNDSELSYLNKAKDNVWLNASDEMIELLIHSQKACYQSNGSFDITIGKLTKAWRQSKKDGIMVNKNGTLNHLKNCGCHQFKIDKSTNKVIKKNADFSFDFGGIAKGYIAGKVSEFLKKKGLTRHLIDAGGDLVAGKKPINEKGWKIAIELPSNENDQSEKMVLIKNQSIATSGSTYQFIEIDGNIFSHILNPKTGYGISDIKNVTIISPNGTDADWLATACSVLTISDILELLKKYKTTSCIISYLENEKPMIKVYGKSPAYAK